MQQKLEIRRGSKATHNVQIALVLQNGRLLIQSSLDKRIIMASPTLFSYRNILVPDRVASYTITILGNNI